MIKNLLFFAQLLISPLLMAETTVNEITPFALITIPKSGSHLVMKAIYFLTGSVPVWHTRFPSLYYIRPQDGFLYTHFCLSPELERDYAELPSLKKIIFIRDLRDVALSIVEQIRKNLWPGLSGEMRQEFLKLSHDEQLLFVINFDYDVHEVSEYAPNSLQVSLAKIGEQALKYANDASYLTCSYENLVGPLGGGTEEAQIKEIEKLSEFLGLSSHGDDIAELAAKLYGNEVNPFGKEGLKNFQSTFHKGQIGNWKHVFNQEHKEAFKKKLGKYLIGLGYEKDDNW